MNQRSLRVLEWPKIQQVLADHAAFSLGKERAQTLQPATDRATVQAALKLTTLAVDLCRQHGFPPFGGAKDICSTLQRAERSGVLNPEELLATAGVIYCSQQMHTYLEHAEEELAAYTAGLYPARKLRQEIERCIDEDGVVRDHASGELASVRNRIRSQQAKIRERLTQLIHSPSVQRMLQDPIVTIRNGRYVLPVKQEYRSRFPGMVQDQSSSGATVFMEPSVSVEVNNQLRVLELQEQQEIERILRRLSQQVQDISQELLETVQTLGDLDLIFARAKYALETRSVEPIINPDHRLDIRQARHPLLQDPVVPIDIWIEDSFILVITGPNTGGKTVSLKTLGLLSLMAQAGLHIPAGEGSRLAIFDGIYADIGDEQSIEQSLSTFSSHMHSIVEILAMASQQSLVLLDELGAGTDPVEGAALAIAILEFLRRRRVTAVATTHYSELKHYAFSCSEIENASVEFDVETLKPTYRLSIGVPGRSNAFAIAERLGLDTEIIRIARSYLSEEQIHADDVIRSMETDSKRAAKARREAEILQTEAQTLRDQLEEQTRDLAERKTAILAQAQAEAEQLLKDTRQEMDRVIGQLRKQQPDAGLEATIKKHREQLDEKQQQLAASQQERKPKQTGPKDLKPGEQVYIKSLRKHASVLESAKDKRSVLVQAGVMRIEVSPNDLERIRVDSMPTPVKREKKNGGSSTSKSDTIRSELDLRGQTVDEALALVDKYLDDAVLSSLQRVRIIHGKGTGALRSAIAEHLRCHSQVKDYHLAAPEEGGSGVTSVELDTP